MRSPSLNLGRRREMSRGGGELEAPPPMELEELVGSAGFSEAVVKSMRLQSLESLAVRPADGGERRVKEEQWQKLRRLR